MEEKKIKHIADVVYELGKMKAKAKGCSMGYLLTEENLEELINKLTETEEYKESIKEAQRIPEPFEKDKGFCIDVDEYLKEQKTEEKEKEKFYFLNTGIDETEPVKPNGKKYNGWVDIEKYIAEIIRRNIEKYIKEYFDKLYWLHYDKYKPIWIDDRYHNPDRWNTSPYCDNDMFKWHPTTHYSTDTGNFTDTKTTITC